MASSTVVANLINREVENSDAWSLGCDITIEEMDIVVEEIKLNDIAIAGVVKTDGISVDIDHDKNNVMDLDVNVVIDGLNSSIVESQVVPYERVVEINDLSPESSYEKGFAASAKSVKKVKDSVDSLDNNVKSNTSNISKVATDIESLTRRVDRLSMSEGGEDLGGIWYIDELTGNLVTDKQVEIKSNLIVAGDTSTGRTGEDPGTTGIDEEQLQDYLDEHKYITSDYPYSKQEVDNKIEGIDVSGQINNALTDYAKTEDVNNALEDKADKTELDKYLLKKAESQEIEGDITIKGNLIITGDTSTGGTGQDVPSGIDEAQLKEYLDTNKYITSDYAYSKEEVNRLIDEVNAGDIDLTNYYTKEETASEISKAIEGIDIPSLDGYATEKFVSDSITGLNVGQYATKTALETLQGEVDNIESVLGMDEEAEGIINTWNEVKAFLDGYSSSDDLAAILSSMNADIAKRALGSDLDALAVRVGVNESAIADNATNIRNAKGEIDGLKDNKANWGTTLAHYGITDAYTKTEVANELAKYLLLESANQTIKGNITIEGNLIVKGDTSSTARGTDSGTDGTLIGVVVNGTRYEDETNGMLDLSSLMNQYALATDIPSLEAYALKTEIPTTMAWTAITGKPSFASVATSGSYNDLSNKPTIPTTLPASDVYAWAKAATKPSYKTSEVAEETNLYFTNARAVSALADTLKDYVTKTALASDLGEYASKEWVNEKGYITGITLTGDDYISVNGYKLSLAIDAQGGLTNTGQGLGIYQIPSAKIVTDALGYTPFSTSGGTISGTLNIDSTSKSDNPLSIRSNVTDANGACRISFYDSSNAFQGYVMTGWGNLTLSHRSRKQIGVGDSGIWCSTDNGTTQNTLYHTGNFNPSDYLPKSGGTIKRGSNGTPLVVDTDGSEIGLSFRIGNTNKGWVGYTSYVGTYIYDYTSTKYLGIRESGTPFYYDGDYRTLIHSGNYTNYAVKYDGGASADNSRHSLGLDNGSQGSTNLPAGGGFITMGHDSYGAQLLGSYVTEKLYFRSLNNNSWGTWKTIAFTDSTVAAANKLVTSAGADAVIVGASRGIKVLYNGSDFFINSLGLVVQRENLSSDVASTGMALIARDGKGSLLYGGPNGFIVYHYDGANPTQHMTINSSGNVTIGASDLASTTCKLYVDGGIRFAPRTIWGQSFDGTGNVSGAMSAVSQIKFSATKSFYLNSQGHFVPNDKTSTDYWWGVARNDGNYAISTDPTTGIFQARFGVQLAFGSGNVLIGTTTDSGYKLSVSAPMFVGSYASDTAYTLGSKLEGASLIGTTAYGMQLWTRNTGNVHMQVGRVDGNAAAYNLILQEAGGNVGIGITNPSYKLHVNGDIRGNVLYGTTLYAATGGDGIYLTGSGIYYHNSSNQWVKDLVTFASDGSSSFKGAVAMSSTLDVTSHITTSNRVYAPYVFLGKGAQGIYLHTTGISWHNTSNSYVADLVYFASDSIALQKAVTMSSTLSVTEYIGVGYGGVRFANNASYSLFMDSSNKVNLSGHYGINLNGKVDVSKDLNVSGQTTINNNLIVTGDTATGSDIRFKDKLSDHRIALSDIASAPLFTFKWNDREDDSVHLGSSAQYWEKVTPWLVKGEDFKTLDYSTLGVAIGISLANKAVNHEERIKILEKENKALKEQIRRLRYA